MAHQYSGIDGQLLIGGTRIGKVKNWSFTGSFETLETTNLGASARTYSAGVQSYSGSATLFYYENSAKRIEGHDLFDHVIRTSRTPEDGTTELRLRFANGSKTREIRFKCFLNQVEVAATAGEIVEANITFTVDGPLTYVNFQN